MSQLTVDPGTLRELAGTAHALAAQVGALGEAGGGEASAATMGDAGLAAAIEAFTTSWRARAVELQAELEDAGDFLATFADTTEQADADLAGTAE